MVEEVMVKLMALPKNPSVVKSNDLQDGGMHSQAWRFNNES